MPATVPLVNGARHSHVSVELNINGIVRPIGVKSIDYERKRTRGKLYGTHPDPIGKTRGKNEYSGSIELYLEEFQTLQLALGPGYGDTPMLILCTYGELGVSIITDELIGCTLDLTNASSSEGTDGTVRKIELDPLKILFNGIDDCLVPLLGVA